jgi:hypothetical protein
MSRVVAAEAGHGKVGLSLETGHLVEIFLHDQVEAATVFNDLLAGKSIRANVKFVSVGNP